MRFHAPGVALAAGLLLAPPAVPAAEVARVGTGYAQGLYRFPEVRGAGVMVTLRPEAPPAWARLPAAHVYVELGAGELVSGDSRVTMVTLGPAWQYRARVGRQIAFTELGISPTLLSSDRLGERDLGSSFHFTSHVAVGLHFGPARGWTMLTRVQHTSNAGIADPNPGFELGGVELHYDLRF
jgi:hypothetical protein